MNVQSLKSSNMDQQPYRRTYLHLSDVLVFMKKLDKTSHTDHPLFLVSFSVYFLLDGPHFNFDAHGSSSVQTFYANHYLRETLNLQTLPDPKKVLEYIRSSDFKNALEDLLPLFAGSEGREVDRSMKMTGQDDDPLRPTAPPVFYDLLKLVLNGTQSSSSAAYISKKDQPSDTIFREIKESGFAVEHDFLTRSTLSSIADITQEIAEYEKRNGSAYFYGTEGKNQRIYNLLAKHPIFADLISAPYLLALLDRVFDRPTLHEKFGLNSLTAHIVPPGAKAIPMHIDSVCPDPIPPWMIRFIIILPLDNFTKRNGATTFVPGSHKLLRRPGPTDLADDNLSEVVAECNAGSLVLFDGATWHRSSDNQTKNYRPGLMLSFAASYFMELCGEEEHLTIIPQNIIQDFSPKVKQMIGYRRAIKKGAMDISDKIRKIDY